MQLSRNKDTVLKDLLILNNTFESFNNIPLFELGQRFLLQNIVFKKNTFTTQLIFAYKSDFNGISMDDEYEDDNQIDLNEMEHRNDFDKSDHTEVNNSTIS